jgi:hypothetical protein
MDDEVLLLDMHSNRIHQLNPTASFVWRKLAAPVSVDEMAGLMVRAFQISPEVAARDAADALERFKELELILDSDDQDETKLDLS